MAGGLDARRGGGAGPLSPWEQGFLHGGQARGSTLSELQAGFKAGARCLSCRGRTASPGKTQPRVLLLLVLHHCSTTAAAKFARAGSGPIAS